MEETKQMTVTIGLKKSQHCSELRRHFW